ncbi:unnamed protein product [Meloidogyne enterolobii]|uniref:K Homology domain-containing protein n=2 Tax=Meloidogyne enterolobii TaxID=390850 RepID=A0A6V7VRQ9_MELEN|nr:unnamed protein product [Meloidogyne enterolobii]
MSEEYKPDDSEINIQIGQKRQNNENGGPASKKANVSESDTVQIKVLIPSAAVGALIGKGGETMRNLKNDTGCRVQMSKNQEFYHGTTERICFVKGKISSAMIVMGAILEKIQEKVEGHHPSDPFDLKGLQRTNEMKFIVPNTSAGMVIGKNGTSIKEIRETTTANIQIYPKAGTEEAKMSLERVITIGHETNDVLMSAMQKVLERVCADPLHSQPITSESQNVSSGYDFATSRVTTGASQFAGMQSTPAWQNQTSIDQKLGNQFNSNSIKFNPLQGTGNNELLAFLDNLQSTLRSSGFNDQSVSEVMQAMQVLAKYNIMGLGLGLGVAAMAQMRNSENAAVQQQNALIGVQNASMQQQRYDVMSHPQNANMMTGNSLMDAHNNSLDQSIGGAGGVLIDVMSQKKSGGVVSNAFANSLIKERILEDGRVELEVPDNIIGAVLGPRAKTLIEIQQLSGAKIEVHKRGSATTSPGGRLVSLTGDNNSIVNGRLMIEKVINQEQQRRSLAGNR